MMVDKHNCCQIDKLIALETEVAELNARLDGKRNDITSINEELLRDRQQQTELLEKVTRVTVLLEEGQKQRTANNVKLEELEKKIDKLQEELVSNRNDVAESTGKKISKLQDDLVENKSQVTELTSSLNSFRNTMLALIPIISIIVGILLHFIRI